MAANYATVEVWVKVNEAGDYEVGTNADEAAEKFEDHIGTDKVTGYRMVKLTVRVPLPKTLELVGEATEDEEAGELKVA